MELKSQSEREALVSEADAYIRRYTRRKGEPLPTSPVAFSQDDLRSVHRLVKGLNEMSGEEMKQKNQAIALELLEKAERLAYVMRKKADSLEGGVQPELLRLISRAQSLTYNNIGCYYMSRQKYVVALEYLEKTLRVEQSAKLPPKDLGTTCSNVTAVLSKLGRHEEAREYAERAVSLLERADESSEGKNSDLALFLATAYFNFSVECEYLRRFDQATSLLKQGLEIAEQRLGSEHPMTKQMRARLKPTELGRSTFSPKSVSSDEFSNASVSEDQRSELKVVHQGYRSLGGTTHKVIIYGRTGSQMLRCVAFTRAKDHILKLTVPNSSAPLEEILDRLSIQQGRLVLGNKPADDGSRRLFTVSASVGEATYSAVISSDGQSKSVTWSDSTPAHSDEEPRLV